MAIYDTLKDANAARELEWRSTVDGKPVQLPLSYWGNAMAGEAGEACNVIKKLERERYGLKGSRSSTS